MERHGADDGACHPTSDEENVYPHLGQRHETGRRYPLGAGPLKDHAGKGADVGIGEDSVDETEDIRV